MASNEKRLNDLEEKKTANGGETHVLQLPDNGRSSGGFKVKSPHDDHILIIPQSHSVWPDGVNVFSTMASPPVDGRQLTDDDWSELSRIELLYQRKESEE